MSTATDVAVDNECIAYRATTVGGLRLTRFSLPGRVGWQAPEAGGPDFGIEIDGQWVDGSANLHVEQVEQIELDEAIEFRVTLRPELPLRLIHHAVVHHDTALVELWITVINLARRPVRIGRVDSIALDLPTANYELLRWSSAWGAEFEPQRTQLTGAEVVGTTAGSSQGAHPMLLLHRADGGLLAASVMWSGNWIMRLDPQPDGGFRLSGGLHDEGFTKKLPSQESFESPHVTIALGHGDLDSIATQYARAGRQRWYPRNTRAAGLPIEWNHWWSYEDAEIDEATFRRNVDVARRIGIEVCTLDAGWFGPSRAATHWVDYRGDWALVNSERFPSGIPALADYVHASGRLFGIWCEIEAVGPKADLAHQHPGFLATNDEAQLGYLCFGNPAVQEWAFEALESLVTDYTADWIKLDFNLDPGLGCTRTDHGHGEGDGLFEHYRGYYGTLDRFRASHPDVVLENCSSSGLRIDLEMLRHTDLTFLSDPDWPEHGLQLLWGASLMFAPDRLLHWGSSQWRGEHPRQTFDPQSPSLTAAALAYYRRIAMLGATGCSFRLPDLPGWVRKALAEHHRFYADVVRRFVQFGEVHHLTGQPRRDGRAPRWAAFQYSLPASDEHLVFLFRLDGGSPKHTVRLRGLDPTRDYTLRWTDSGATQKRSGAELQDDGIEIDTLEEEGSEILQLEPTNRRSA